MHHFSVNNAGMTRRIAAHRQTWINTDTLDMTSTGRFQVQQHIEFDDRSPRSRYHDQYAEQRTSMIIYQLIDTVNSRRQQIEALFQEDKFDADSKSSIQPSPHEMINELFIQSNLPIQISIGADQRVMAAKNGGPEFSAAELSDGERNVLLLASSVLTAPNGSLLVIDEPERHLHRSIISPLLKRLFERRPDCGFVVSTHDHDLPLQIPAARVLLLRSCDFTRGNVQNWDADEIPSDSSIEDGIKRDLLGGRRKILFVEGTEHSLDKSLYSLIFPMVSVIPKGSCGDVEHAVEGVRGAESFHWIHAFGIIDGDGVQPEQVQRKRNKGVYVLPLYSIESIYYHPIVIARVAARLATSITGGDAHRMAAEAIKAAVGAMRGDTKRLTEKVVKRLIRNSMIEQVPSGDVLLSGENITLQNEAKTALATRINELDNAVLNCDWEAILKLCSVRETGSLEVISRSLGFSKRRAYEDSVRHLLHTDERAVDLVRDLFGDLFDRLSE